MNIRFFFGIAGLLLLALAAFGYITSRPASTKVVTTEPAPVATSTPAAATSTPQKPIEKPATTTISAHSKEIKITAYLTGYAWPDNTPPGSAISHPVIHLQADGTGCDIAEPG